MVIFFLGHNLLYCGLRKDILLSFVAFDKICRREMRAGAKLRFQHIFREMRASGAKKRDQSGCKTDNSLRFQPHFLAPSNPFPVFFCVCGYLTSFQFSLSCSYLLPFVSFSGYSSVFSFPYLLFSLFFYSLITILSDFPADLSHFLERF